MFPKQNRLLKKDHFPLKAQGRTLRSESFTLIFTDKLNTQPPKLAIIVSKKVSKLAVQRNQIKRKLRVIISQTLPSLKQGFHCLLIVKPSALKHKFINLKNEFRALISRSPIIQTPLKQNV